MLKRLTIENMHEAAKGLGGKCLSDSYVNNSTRLEWECATGHRWSAIPMSVRKGHWCPLCASKSRGEKTVLSDGLERCRSVAARRGGRVLSATYLGSQTHISVECDSGHQFSFSRSLAPFTRNRTPLPRVLTAALLLP